MMSKQSTYAPVQEGILLRGYQKKLKTMKKKYFVLYEETASNGARLEYFDNEKKFKTGSNPKRVIKLKNCFNINRRLDTKHEYVIALSTKDGGFGIVLESEAEMLKWLEVLIMLQRTDDTACEQPRPYFEHVWQVVVQRRGLAEEKGIVGNYHACLTLKSLTFIKIGSEQVPENRTQNIEFQLTTIRRCGDSQCFFYMEVGRQSIIGPGELWMETEDALIAQNMHNMILSAMSSKNDTNMDPMRKRSSSANEATNPVSILLRKQIQTENKPNNQSYNSGLLYGRDRCDSLPSSRNRTTSECSSQGLLNSSIPARNVFTYGLRPQSLHYRLSNSPPVGTAIGCSESEESSLSIDEQDDSGIILPFRFHSRSSDGVIPEENCDEIVSNENKCHEDANATYLNESNYAQKSTCDKQNYVESKKSNSFLADIIHLPKHIRSICSEYQHRSTKLLENKEQSYISMGPSCGDSETAKRYITMENSDLDPIPPLCLVDRGKATNDIQFLECTSDNISTNIINDGEITSERPTRAYSIGSRLEHNRFKMRLCASSDSDQTTPRVRAFSVGSRSKIPRCDFQRGILNYRSVAEQNSNGSSNNIKHFMETATNYQFLNLSSTRDKKSSSAPLLIHKSQNSVDQMGDLMEIDFSKSPNNSCHRTMSSPPTTIYPVSMSFPVSNHDQIDTYKTFLSSQTRTTSSTNNSSLLKKLTTDNGYLEMKPVSLSSIHNSISITNKNGTNANNYKYSEYLPMSPKTTNAYRLPENKNAIILNAHETNDNPAEKVKIADDNEKYIQAIKGENKPEDKEENKSINFNMVNSLNIDQYVETDNRDVKDLNSKAHQMCMDEQNESVDKIFLTTEDMSLSNKHSENNNINFSKYINLVNKEEDALLNDNLSNQSNIIIPTKPYCVDKPIVNVIAKHSNVMGKNNDDEYMNLLKLNEDLIQQNSEGSVQINDFGYEILQIKSDSSLQSNKILHRPSSIRLDKQPLHPVLNRPSSANSGCLPMLPSTSSGCGASTLYVKNKPTSIYRPLSISGSLCCIGNRLNDIPTTNIQDNCTSRPPSVSSERELYYASLDLPQCSSERKSSAMCENKGSNCEESLCTLSKFNNLHSSFTYAKINFDHCESSNVSSKLSKNS